MSYPATSRSSVEADHERSACVEEIAAAVTFAGTVGGWVSSISTKKVPTATSSKAISNDLLVAPSPLSIRPVPTVPSDSPFVKVGGGVTPAASSQTCTCPAALLAGSTRTRTCTSCQTPSATFLVLISDAAEVTSLRYQSLPVALLM